MRQVQRQPARTSKPAPTTGPADQAVRPSLRRWLERLDPTADPWPRPIIRTHREGR